MMNTPGSFDYKGMRVRNTQLVNPETYEVFKRKEHIGHMRVKHGRFAVYSPPIGTSIVYEARTEGDGNFSVKERERLLFAGLEAIMTHPKKEGMK